MKEQFKQFLKDNNALEAFENELLIGTLHVTLDEYIDRLLHKAGADAISAAFSWPKEDLMYWYKLDQLWKEIVNSNIYNLK